ncbi:MAG: aminoacyl-tRNA hydrolase [Candidatus Zixiibacteriota bacterium]|nr:MAG: aminoacyl-tRNA hydrolase [candidate division Zixibacteria bacterium]
MISLVLGLGNIGTRYNGTRHNTGFEALSRLAGELNAVTGARRDHYEFAVKPTGREPAIDREVFLAWPTTLMNRSGLAVRVLLDDFELELSEMLVVVDDINLPLGTLRFRADGSDGGHNGLASIIGELGTGDFQRLRLGIGPPVDTEDIAEFVLSRFLAEETERVKTMLDTACKAVMFAIDHRLEEAMMRYNSCPALPEDM